MLVTQPNISLVPLHNTGENIDQKFQCCRSFEPCHKNETVVEKCGKVHRLQLYRNICI